MGVLKRLKKQNGRRRYWRNWVRFVEIFFPTVVITPDEL